MSTGGNQGPTPPADKPPQGEQQQQQQQQSRRERERQQHIATFVVECGDECNRQIPLDYFKTWLRGRWLASNVKCEMGDIRKMPPEIPGIRLEINPRDLKLRIFDPLEKNPKLLTQINEITDQIVSIKTGRKLTPWELKEYDLNEVDQRWPGPDLLKSLMLEISRKVHGPMPCMFQVSGTVPLKEQLVAYPGREIYDPWSNSTQKPIYVDELRAWSDKFERMLLAGEAAASLTA